MNMELLEVACTKNASTVELSPEGIVRRNASEAPRGAVIPCLAWALCMLSRSRGAERQHEGMPEHFVRYARVSTHHQNENLKRDAFTLAGANGLYVEVNLTGVSTDPILVTASGVGSAHGAVRLDGMSSVITWTSPRMTTARGRRRPDFGGDDGFTPMWWGPGATVGPPDHEWRSYSWNGEEVARLLLAVRYSSHSGPEVPAVMIWTFEVRQDLQRNGSHIGTSIIEKLTAECRDREIYIGPAPDAIGFWSRLNWSMCDCGDCDDRDFLVRRP